MEIVKPEAISEQDWEATPKPVRELINHLLSQLTKLEEKANKNSQNSDKPPSSDGPSTKKRKKRPTGRKPGGQPGHQGSHRKAVEQVQVIEVKPSNCEACGESLSGSDKAPESRQVTELPEIKPQVIEYQLHSLKCHKCGHQTKASKPGSMPNGAFGARLQALIGYLGGQARMSHRQIQTMLKQVFGIEISLGSIPAQQQQVSKALEKPVKKALEHCQKAPVANVDETSWKKENKRCWLWVIATQCVISFLILDSRSQESAKKLLGEQFDGIAGTDRYSAYNYLDQEKRQFCWAHLLRDFEAMAARAESSEIGQALLELTLLMFELWHSFKVADLTRTEFQDIIKPIQQQIELLLEKGAKLENSKTGSTCRNILSRKQCLWHFVNNEGVEPTNNAAEQALRQAVLWRKSSFGSQSKLGAQFVERILTVQATLRQQGGNLFDFLIQACLAFLTANTPPSLLPDTQT